MKVPEKFKRKLEDKEKEEKKKRQEEIRNEKRERELKKKAIERERKKEKEKVELCKKIFQWRKEFLETPEGKELFKRSNSYLWVTGGGWGHTLPSESGGGCWSRIYFNGGGIEYWSGYKWMGGGKRFQLNKPEEMAEKLSYDYLKEIWEDLKGNKVWEFLERELKW